MSLQPDDNHAMATARHGIDLLHARVDDRPDEDIDASERDALRKCLASADDLLTMCEGLLEGTDGLTLAEREQRIERLVHQAKHVAHGAYDAALAVTGDPGEGAEATA